MPSPPTTHIDREQDQDSASRSGRHKTVCIKTCNQPSDVFCVQTINIFGRINFLYQSIAIKMIRYW